MAIVTFLMGSLLGLFGAVSGWLFFDLSLLVTVSLYFGTSISVGILPLAAYAIRHPDVDDRVFPTAAR